MTTGSTEGPIQLEASFAKPVRIFQGAADDVARRLLSDKVEADLIYLDPPFGVGMLHGARLEKGQSRASRDQVAYDDPSAELAQFLALLRPTLQLCHQLLSKRGTLYLHMDHRAIHESKIELDGVFGRSAFRGEVIWVPGNGARGKRAWGWAHQTILCYTRDNRPNPKDPAWVFSPAREPYAAGSSAQHFKENAAGQRIRERTVQLANGPKTYRYVLADGRRMGTVWSDIPAMAANTPIAKETTGYPHQKPEKLLERLILASSEPGSTVVDLFCGSGTTTVVAARLLRHAIGGDLGDLAIATTHQRLRRSGFIVEHMDVRPASALAGC